MQVQRTAARPLAPRTQWRRMPPVDQQRRVRSVFRLMLHANADQWQCMVAISHPRAVKHITLRHLCSACFCYYASWSWQGILSNGGVGHSHGVWTTDKQRVAREARGGGRLNTKDLQAVDALVRTVFRPHVSPDRLALLGGAAHV